MLNFPEWIDFYLQGWSSMLIKEHVLKLKLTKN